MAEVERIWRITTDAKEAIEVRLSPGFDSDQRVILEQLGADPREQGTFDVEVARALAQTILEACEVASALGEQGT